LKLRKTLQTYDRRYKVPAINGTAQQIGFVVIDTGIQSAGDVDEEELLEVRSEIHVHDLAHGRGPSLRVRSLFGRSACRCPVFPRQAGRR
jgi:hypothetical protein